MENGTVTDLPNFWVTGAGELVIGRWANDGESVLGRWANDCESCELITKFGAQNRVFAARTLWDKPNRLI